jgi:hypothetical protein
MLIRRAQVGISHQSRQQRCAFADDDLRVTENRPPAAPPPSGGVLIPVAFSPERPLGSVLINISDRRQPSLQHRSIPRRRPAKAPKNAFASRPYRRCDELRTVHAHQRHILRNRAGSRSQQEARQGEAQPSRTLAARKGAAGRALRTRASEPPAGGQIVPKHPLDAARGLCRAATNDQITIPACCEKPKAAAEREVHRIVCGMR